MKGAVVESWIGHAPSPLIPGLPGLTTELTQVAVFLAAFSGLYFTVYAVTDENYRRQFFTAITNELERAVGVRAVYQALRKHSPGRHTRWLPRRPVRMTSRDFRHRGPARSTWRSCLLYTSPSPRDGLLSRMPSS